MHFADRIIERARELQTAVCVGIDPRYEMLPEGLRARAKDVSDDPAKRAAWSYAECAARVIEATAPYACAVKPQAAFFESLGTPGYEALEKTVKCARGAGLPVILDAKRADIGSTSAAYAEASFGGREIEGTLLPGLDADALTVNPYFGTDGIAPFLKACDERDRGLFVLVRTSNPTAAELQDVLVSGEGGIMVPLWRRVAALVARWGEPRTGKYGYSLVGAVGGATTPETLREVRSALPRSILLVPGYGAQGGTAGNVVNAFDASGEGAIVNASRSIVFAKRDAATVHELAAAAAVAAEKMRDAINEALSKR
jgi:orotidine-5'-phosphate decarboxylase